MVLCVVGPIPREISRFTWFAIEGGANITAQVVSTNNKSSPLQQGGLEIEIKVKAKGEECMRVCIFGRRTRRLN